MGTLMDTETGDITGTMDKDYNIIWFTETCLSNVLRLEVFAKDAERGGDNEPRRVLPQGPDREPQGRGAGQAAARRPARRLIRRGSDATAATGGPP